MKPRLAAIAAVLAAAGAAAGASLYSTVACGCLSPAQDLLGKRWPEMSRADLRLLASRIPAGTPVEHVHQALGASGYARYCTDDRASRRTVCMLPLDRNFWRERAAQVTFAYDAGGITRSMNAELKNRYLWE